VRGEVDTNRLEAFSDGVFAISITLLIVGVGIKAEGGSLVYRLAEQWPSYVSYVVSFAIIGILWLHHHEMFRDIRTASQPTVTTAEPLILPSLSAASASLVCSSAKTSTWVRIGT
jgi:uncharacterized membrane protein